MGSARSSTRSSAHEVVLVLLVAVALGFGFATVSQLPQFQRSLPGPRSSSTHQEGEAAELRRSVDRLRVVERPAPDPSYRRAAFGPAWKDIDGDGCSQRRNSLAAAVDRSRPLLERQRGRCAHEVVAGTWTDPYTGQLMTFSDLTDPYQAQQIPIDHVVALANAYRYGAKYWSDEQRLVFANDLSNLQPTSRLTNLQKSDHDAAAWRPAAAFQCSYAGRYIRTKVKYQLAVDLMEKRALANMLQTCP